MELYYCVILEKNTKHLVKESNFSIALSKLYFYLLDANETYNFDQLSFVILFYDIIVTKYHIFYNNGLFLNNEDSCIKISSIYPQYICLDNIIKDRMVTDKNLDKKELKLKDVFVPNNIIDKRERRPSTFPKNEQSTSNVIQNNITNNKYPQFESDKRSYFLIKSDINCGKIKIDEINPMFTKKYLILKVLDSRNQLNEKFNDNITEEKQLFDALFSACAENEDDKCIEIVQNNPNSIYIPHNYEYMSDKLKENYAHKFKLTRNEFEEKYIKCMDNDDPIELHFEKVKTDTIQKNKNLDSSDDKLASSEK
uniref:Uncharacterized protein n=1 Tax=viral metagenome TaxID=1070528 RepID=A0A6C0LSK1_9ZZZZ